MWSDSPDQGGGSKDTSSPREQDGASNLDTDKEAEAAGATGRVPQQDVTGLKGNFEQQQAMIGQLRDMLKHKEASKKQEKEMEDYATRLAKMKPRLIRGKGRGRSKDREELSHRHLIQTSPKKQLVVQEQSQIAFHEPVSDIPVVPEEPTEASPSLTPETSKDSDVKPCKEEVLPETVQPQPSTPKQETGSRSKILLLRKQLEENRLKFERQQRENADKRAVMEDMKERIEKLRMEVEQRDTLIQSLQEVDSLQHSDPNVQHLYKQILHKDNTILELSDKMNQLENVIKDQQEQLNEKDQIISARTEAVSLITKDRDEKLMKTIQELEELKCGMKEMQGSATHKEEIWKDKESTFESMIAEKSKKITVLEENCHRIESIRFELSARNAELQEKIVSLQCDSRKLKIEFTETKTVIEQKSEQVSDLKKKLVRAEAFGQKKLKLLEKQIKAMSDDSNLGNKILELQNQIAELEEEKGNLQLKLVDFDELKSQCERLNESVTISGLKIEQLNSEILSQITAVTQLENEKIKLIEELNSKDVRFNSLEETASQYKTQFEDMKQSKVTLELRLCELEEERDLALKKRKDLENELKKVDTSLTEETRIENKKLEEEIIHFKMRLEERDSKIVHFENILLEKDNLVKQIEDEKEEKVNENQCLISFLAEKENLISSQTIKIEKHDFVVQKLQEEMSSKENYIKNLITQSSNLQLELDTLSEKLHGSDLMVIALNEQIRDLQNKVTSNEKTISLLKASEKSLNSALSEKKKALQVLDGEICYLKEELSKKESVLTDQINRIETIDTMLQSREKQILNLESEIADKLRENSQQQTKCSKYEDDLKNLKHAYQNTESRLTAECDTIACLLSDKDNQVKVLEQEVNSKITELKNSEVMASKFEQEVCEKNRLYDALVEENNLLKNDVARFEAKLADLESNSEIKNLDISMLQHSLSEKDNSLEHLKNEISTDLEKFKDQATEYTTLEKEKEKLEEDISELKASFEAKENHYQQLQVEFQTCVTSKENENSNLLQTIAEKDYELDHLKNSLSSFTDEASLNTEYTKNIKLELTDKCQKISLLENEILVKTEKIKALQMQIQTDNENISHLNATRNESEYYKKQAEELGQKLEQLMQQKAEADSFLQSLETTKAEKEQEIISLQNEIENKNATIISFQNSADISSAILRESENMKLYIHELQENINEKSVQLNQSNEFFETRIQDEEIKFMKLQGEFNKCQTDLHEKQNEILNFKTSYDDLSLKFKYIEELSHSQTLSIQGNETHLIELSNRNEELEANKLVCEKEMKELKQKAEEAKSLYNNLVSQYESLSRQLLLKDEEISTLHSSLNSKSFSGPSSGDTLESVSDSSQGLKQEGSKLYEEENNNLKKRLEEAQQAIIRLETSLATQSFTQESSQEGSDGWGIVDLGEPSVAEPSLSMQTSLMEKDKTLTVIQEQLKFALEDVNAANDEKKIIQHQMNTLEAELSHKDQKVTNLEAYVSELESKVIELNKKIHELSSATMSLSEDRNIQMKAADQQSCLPSEVKESSVVPSHSGSTPSWFKQSSEDSSKNFWDNIESNVSDPQVSTAPTNQEATYEQNTEVQSEFPQEAEKPSADSEAPVEQSLEELQYKLSWYEENWATWTEHYNQLQANYQTAEQQIAFLNQELETLKDADASKEEEAKQDENLVMKLNTFQETINILREENSKLEETIRKNHAEESTTLDSLTSLNRAQLEEASQEISRLKGFETQVYELQGQLQTLQHQCSVLETKVADTETNSSKLREYEMLYGELQTCMQESETKREGSKSRVQELELMVQSAESEIARLRTDMQKLTTAGSALEGERNALQGEIESLKEEVRKNVAERERFEGESDRLQREAASLHSQSVELQSLIQRNQGEIDQLKSEIEVLEGENDRTRSNFEIIEAEANRLRNENEVLTQNNQIALAEKESLETEAQRLESSNSSLSVERDHIRGEMQRLSEMTTSAESEITRLKMEVQNMSYVSSQYQELERKYADLQERLKEAESKRQKERTREDSQELHLEEVDWGTEAKIEDEHLQRSSSVERALHEELSQLKEKIITLEKEKNEISEELQSAKLKNGKMIQKLKAANNKNENLLKEMQKLKQKAGGFSDLDLALEEEWKLQVNKAENEKDELKIKLDEMEKEKHHLKDRLDVLESAQDKFFEMKESQDVTIRQLSSRNKNLESQISSLEWKMSELEENLEPPKEESVSDSQPMDSSMIEEFKLKISSLESEIEELRSENLELKEINEKLKPKLDELSEENETLISALEDLRDAKSKAEMNANTYKTSFLELHTEHETVQENYTELHKELESLKYEQATLKAAYDVLYEEYHQLEDNRDSVRLELGIITGERDKLQEEVNSLNNQLQALQEEEEEEIIRALQDECADLRVQNNELKDEVTRMTESLRQMEETVERTKHSLDQQVDIQDLLRSEVVTKSVQNDLHTTTINRQEQQIKYMNAEIAFLKTKCSQQQQALEEVEPQLEHLKETLAEVQEKNQQLTKQVEVADASLVKLATRQTNEEAEERFSTFEASELEAALSSLHLRDLRCQQLSLEINKLLEERDGLQLKLSAALRQNQDLSRELSLSQQLPPPQTPPPSLSQKLAELRDLNNSLEQKALDNLRIGNVASSFGTFVSHTAPATPTATRHRDYTVTRENQGASSVIMNWLLGKSTPKEVLHV